MLSVPEPESVVVGKRVRLGGRRVTKNKMPLQVPLARQEFWEMAKGPVMVTLLTDMPTEPVLVTWTFCAALVIPTATEPNERLAGETETEATGATPAPARVTG